MIKKIIVIFLSLLLVSLTTIYYVTNLKSKSMEIDTKKTEEKELKEVYSLTLVLVGEPIKSKEISFLQWNSLNKSEQIKTLKNHQTFLFSSKEFQNKNNLPLIKELIQNKKTVLFYGYRMNVKDILTDSTTSIPYFEIASQAKIYHYLYGYGYSDKAKKMYPITLLGNFPKKKMDQYINNYLLKNFSDKTQKAGN